MSSEPAYPANNPVPAPAPVSPETQPEARFPWRLFFLLAVMMLVASMLLLPYAIQLATIGSPQAASNLPQIILLNLVQVAVIYLPLLLLGLVISRRLGLGAPYLQAFAQRTPAPGGFRRALIFAAAIGFGAGVVLLVLAGAFNAILPPELTAIDPAQVPSAFQGFLASISAGINEEILLRLFLLALIAWLAQLLTTRRGKGRPSTTILWVANVLAAVIFGLLHLPNLAAMNVPVTPAILGYIILLNGLAGLGFGWLFWTFGLEAAMLAHFFTDIVLHVIARLFS